ncbi:MAG: hypothetical protein QXL14_02415, partial [Candidatus Aenigmatarchaeota archaeon]
MISATIIPQDIKIDNQTLEINSAGYLRVKIENIIDNNTIEIKPNNQIGIKEKSIENKHLKLEPYSYC